MKYLNISFVFKINATFIVFALFLFLGCQNKSYDPVEESPNSAEAEGFDNIDLSYLPLGKGSTTPYMKGTFIDFWYKSNWTSSDWDNHMAEMQEIGIETLIVQFAAYEDNIWIESSENYSYAKEHPNALGFLLEAAKKHNIGVYVGLYFSEEYWENATNTSTLYAHSQRSKDLATKIWSVHKDNDSFKGWYISHEPARYYYQTHDDLMILTNDLINPIADHCKSISGKPVSISAFFNYNLTDIDQFSTFISGLGASNVELIILQDGIGVDHCDLASIESYYAAANKALYEDNDFKGAFWADIETFKNDNPESIDVIIEKFTSVSPYVSFIATFQYFADMSPKGPKSNLSKKLRDDYQKYLK